MAEYMYYIYSYLYIHIHIHTPSINNRLSITHKLLSIRLSSTQKRKEKKNNPYALQDEIVVDTSTYGGNDDICIMYNGVLAENGKRKKTVKRHAHIESVILVS